MKSPFRHFKKPMVIGPLALLVSGALISSGAKAISEEEPVESDFVVERVDYTVDSTAITAFRATDNNSNTQRILNIEKAGRHIYVIADPGHEVNERTDSWLFGYPSTYIESDNCLEATYMSTGHMYSHNTTAVGVNMAEMPWRRLTRSEDYFISPESFQKADSLMAAVIEEMKERLPLATRLGLAHDYGYLCLLE